MSKGHKPRRSANALSDLLAIGKTKGFLTYEEVNALMPESVVSQEEIDVWVSALGREGIEILDKPPGDEDEDEDENPSG